jgi:hypothetical protein
MNYNRQRRVILYTGNPDLTIGKFVKAGDIWRVHFEQGYKMSFRISISNSRFFFGK